MTVEINNAEAVTEIEILMEPFGLSAQIVIERLVIDAGCWIADGVHGGFLLEG